MKAAAAIVAESDWEKSVWKALSQTTAEIKGSDVDLALLFVSSPLVDYFDRIVSEIRKGLKAKILAGCSGGGVIGQSREIEAEPAISLMLLSLPETQLRPYYFYQEGIEECTNPAYWHAETGIGPHEVNFWILFADPFQTDVDRLISQLNDAYPGKPVVGGIASGDFSKRSAYIFLNDEIFDCGGVGIGVSGATVVRPIVAQGCMPIGEPHIITRVERNLILSLSQKPAYQVLAETFQSLSPELQQRAQQNIFLGLVVNEYQEEFHRGDFLIRNILGVDPAMGALAVGALPRLGQTIQFQLRDPASADEDLQELLGQEKLRMARQGKPVAGLLCCCNGRGQGLFGQSSHDAKAVEAVLGPLPLTGFFCNGEIGPVGLKNYLHGYTASLALFAPKTS